EHAARNAEVLDRSRQGEGVGRNDADIAHEIHNRLLIEGLGVHDGRIDVREDLELVRTPHVVAVAAGAVADDAASVGGAHLAGFEGFYHAVGGCTPNPAVALYAHGLNLKEMARILAPTKVRPHFIPRIAADRREKTTDRPVPDH